MAVRLLIFFVFAASALGAFGLAFFVGRRKPSPVKALPPSEQHYYGIAQESARLLERLVDDDSNLPVFARDADRKRAQAIIDRFYKD
jgi:hypothetical protein